MKRPFYSCCYLVALLIMGSSSSYANGHQVVKKTTGSEGAVQINPPMESNETRQLLQGDWLCKETFKGSLADKQFLVNMVAYRRVSGNVITGQRHDYITVTLTHNKKRITGSATVVERGRAILSDITPTAYLSHLVQLDEATWLDVDDNAAGRFIRDDYFPFLDQLTKNRMLKQQRESTYIDHLDHNRFSYHDDTHPATYGDCSRVDTQSYFNIENNND